MNGNREKILVLNDQGGGVMSISYDITATLRSEMKHHEPIVLTYAIDHVVTTGGGVPQEENVGTKKYAQH